MKDRVWKKVVGFEDCYEVSSDGLVRSIDREILVESQSGSHVRKLKGRDLKIKFNPTSGHPQVTLTVNGKHIYTYVHKLVAEAFIGPRPEGKEVCHNDGNCKNNTFENLRYGSRSENRKDAVKHGVHNNANKDRCNRGHLLVVPNLRKAALEKQGFRLCLSCHRARSCLVSKGYVETELKELSDKKYKEIMSEFFTLSRLNEFLEG